jgi:hypothetical protein
MSARLPAELEISMITAVFAPGGGAMVPVIAMGWVPEYAAWSVWSVIVYAAPCAGMACADRRASAKRPARRTALGCGVNCEPLGRRSCDLRDAAADSSA